MTKRRRQHRTITLPPAQPRGLARIARACDVVIAMLKWPAAAAAVLALPLSVVASLRLLGRIWAAPTPAMAFIFGLIAYVAAWQLIFRRRIFGTFFSTLEHELTHAIFALATFHPVTELRSTFTRGGHMRYTKYDTSENWLIAIAPYFFPTLSFALILALALIPPEYRWWAQWLLGAVTAYHITSTMHETHPGQSDLQRVGYLFSFLFLPAANIVSLGIVVAFSHGGLAGVARFIGDMTPIWLRWT